MLRTSPGHSGWDSPCFPGPAWLCLSWHPTSYLAEARHGPGLLPAGARLSCGLGRQLIPGFSITL